MPYELVIKKEKITLEKLTRIFKRMITRNKSILKKQPEFRNWQDSSVYLAGLLKQRRGVYATCLEMHNTLWQLGYKWSNIKGKYCKV